MRDAIKVGCGQICSERLECGHNCPRLCHYFEKSLHDKTGHDRVKCGK